MSKDEVLLEKVLDASSNTIWDELKKIRESSNAEKRIIRRRWVWELIQNASDCTPEERKIDIRIEYLNNQIVFSHNGLPFSYKDLLDLITQISSKQSSKEKKTGKFGTGFMSTHLLSDKVQIKGSFIYGESKCTELDFTIDRSGDGYSEIKNKTKYMLEQLELLIESQDESQESYKDTKFIYRIEDDNIIEAVEEGIEDLKETIPYVLVFNENINSITYNGVCYKRGHDRNSKDYEKLKYVQINTTESQSDLLILNGANITIACPIEHKKGKLFFLPISKAMPRIFCEFPLLGTEEFSFPIIANSRLFEVERDRNAIRDSNQINHKLIKEANSLYKELIDYCSGSNFTRNEYNICILNNPNSSSIQTLSYNETKEKINKSPIVPVCDHSHEGAIRKLAFKDENGKQQIGLPKTKDYSNKEAFWEILSNNTGIIIPIKETFLGWAQVFGDNLDFSYINSRLKNLSIDDLMGWLKGETVHSDWLNSLYSLWIKDEGIEKVVESAYVPNQNNEFVKFREVYLDENLDDELKEIFEQLGGEFRKKLLYQGVTSFEGYFKEQPTKIMTNQGFSQLIDNKVAHILSKETLGSEERKESTQRIFNKLTNWFLSHPEESKRWFENLYSKRMMLSSTEENLRRYKIAEKIEGNNIKYEDLDEIIYNRDRVAEIINSSDLSTDDMIAQLKHVVTSSKEMKQYVEKLIRRSTENIYNYLSCLKDYTVASTLEEWVEAKYSDTVFPANYKGEEIRIIIRPSDYQKIIFYYDEELEALDDYAYQLWTDDGEKQVMITLGDLLKTTGISKIPLSKI